MDPHTPSAAASTGARTAAAIAAKNLPIDKDNGSLQVDIATDSTAIARKLNSPITREVRPVATADRCLFGDDYRLTRNQGDHRCISLLSMPHVSRLQFNTIEALEDSLNQDGIVSKELAATRNENSCACRHDDVCRLQRLRKDVAITEDERIGRPFMN